MKIRERVSMLALISIFASCLFAIQATPASAVACSATGAAQNGITVKPTHGKAFYVDYGLTPKLDANYVGYTVTSTSARKNLWVKLSNFTGGYISLANSADEKMQIAELVANGSKTTYFLLKSTIGATTTDQIHKVEVFQGDPSVSGNTAIYSCDYNFTDIKDVIAANPNKVNSVSINNSTPSLGDLVTVTVTGDTGLVGSGSDSPDLDVIWLSPSPYSNFQTRALRLESVTLNNTSSGRPSSCPTSYEDTLLVTSARTCFDDSNSSYSVLYRFRVIGASSSAVKITPNANISSGNPIKHTSLDPTKVISLNLASITNANFKIKKEVVSTTNLTVTSSKVEVPYRLTITTTSTTNVVLDLVVDSSSATASAFTTGSGTFTDVNRIGTPETAIVPETRSGNGKLYFVGPFTLNSSTPLIINYKMSLPLNGTYRNDAIAFIGDIEVSNTGSGEFRSIDITIPSSCSTPCTVSTAAVVAYSAPTATTMSAINVLSTSATIRGSFTTGGDPNTTVKFFWGTDPTLATSTTVNLGILSTGGDSETALSGLTAGTTYYYRINVSNSISGAGGVNGEILSFTTGAPTATTNSPDQVTGNSARLKGNFTTGGGQNTAVTIRWGTDSTLVAGTNVSLGTFTIDSDTSTVVTGLTPNTDYYYRITAVAGALTANGEIVPFSTLGPSATTVSASGIGQNSATLNGAVGTGGGVTTTPNFQFSKSPTLASEVTSTNLPTISSDGNVNLPLTDLESCMTYYFRVRATIGGVTETGAILSFTTTCPSGGSPAPVPPTPPPGPRIDSISKPEICAIGNDVIISGNYFDYGKVFFDGSELTVKSLNSTSISVTLPKALGGDRIVRVTTPNGSATVIVKYVDVPKPKFVPTLMPYLSQGEYLSLPVTALNATSYSLIGTLPQGLVFDSRSGTISGTPKEHGIFGSVITATGICGETSQVLELDIDKETPNAISHRINILPGATCMSDSAKASLDAFLEKVKLLAPRNLIPEIYLSGGGIGSGSNLGDERRDCLCEVFLDESVYGNVLEGEFIGSANRIEIIVYWARP